MELSIYAISVFVRGSVVDVRFLVVVEVFDVDEKGESCIEKFVSVAKSHTCIES
jgi:hypothetical protein